MSDFVFEAKRYPDGPGCYLMKGASGRVIYVGKAKRLRRRLASYFQKQDLPWRTRRMVEHVVGIEVILVNNETESLVLENNLIKHYHPRYNRMLMAEDSGYFYIVLTDETLPRLEPYRKLRMNKRMGDVRMQQRFGPYPSRRFRETLLDYINDRFRLRTCDPLPQRVCYRFHLDHCAGVCEGCISAEVYLRDVEGATAFLSHTPTELLAAMRAEIEACAARLEFERAQRLKEQAEALTETLDLQIVERDVDYDQDVVVFGEAHALVMHVRWGAILSLEMMAPDPALDDDNALAAMARQLAARHDPDRGLLELVVNRPGINVVAQPGRDVTSELRVMVPQDGTPEAALLALCEKNYRYRTGLLDEERA